MIIVLCGQTTIPDYGHIVQFSEHTFHYIVVNSDFLRHQSVANSDFA